MITAMSGDIATLHMFNDAGGLARRMIGPEVGPNLRWGATMDYYEQLDAIKAAGREYADNGIAAGETEPLESPFSGEWADGLTGQDVLSMVGIKATFNELDGFEQTDVLDYWEDGYYSADWPSWRAE